MFKKKTTKNVLAIIGIVLVSVIVCGIVSNVTNGFNDFSLRKLNEDNLLYDQYSDLDKEEHSSGITFENRNGVIRIDGTIDEDSSDVVYTFATLDLEAGEYTYTCFDKPSMSKYYSYIMYTDSSNVNHVVFADFKSGDDEIAGTAVDGYKTFTIDEDVTAKFVIVIAADQTLRNLKAMPCLVEGDKAGDFYE